MNIKPYVWDIWNIAHENDKDIGIGLDMFIANVRAGFARYAGADDVDYQTLQGEWAELDNDGKKAVYALYDRVKEHYNELVDLRAKGDREGFQAVVEGVE